jgi:hypothetical protein
MILGAYSRVRPPLEAELREEPKRCKEGMYVWLLLIEIPYVNGHETSVYLRTSKQACLAKYEEIVLDEFYNKLSDFSNDEIEEMIHDETNEDMNALVRRVHHYENEKWVLDRRPLTELDFSVLEHWTTHDKEYGKWTVMMEEIEVV